MTESKHIWDLLRPKLSPLVHACRVENMAISGMSDVEACRQGVSIWVELKIAKNQRWRVEFQISQLHCLRRRLSVGGRVWILVRDAKEMRLYNAAHVLRHDRIFAPIKGKRSAWTELQGLPVELATSKPFDYKALEAAMFSSFSWV